MQGGRPAAPVEAAAPHHRCHHVTATSTSIIAGSAVAAGSAVTITITTPHHRHDAVAPSAPVDRSHRLLRLSRGW